MSDYNIKDIEQLKFRIRVVDKVVLAGWALFIFLQLFCKASNFSWSILFIIVILYIFKALWQKKLGIKESLAKMVEERTIELRVQRDQVMKESKKLSETLRALAKAQDELVRREKLVTIGQLTQGLVDRILNPVNYINNFAELSVGLLKDLKRNIISQQQSMNKETFDDSLEILEMIGGNLIKIDEHGCNTVRIVKAMEELLKDHHGDIVSTNMCELCKVNVDVIRKSYQKQIEEYHIQIDLSCPAEPLMADINIEQMNKTLTNLLKNSLYAVEKKKQKTEDFEPLISVILNKGFHDTFTLSIHDNGIGIDENIKEKIFEPFFTTKTTAEAAGVGLYLCREVVLNHHGSIVVNSKKNIYSEFVITIPLHQGNKDNSKSNE